MNIIYAFHKDHLPSTPCGAYDQENVKQSQLTKAKHIKTYRDPGRYDPQILKQDQTNKPHYS